LAKNAADKTRTKLVKPAGLRLPCITSAADLQHLLQDAAPFSQKLWVGWRCANNTPLITLL